ncbi:HEAT repeat domain-containing protein [Streptomyces sp. NPDC048370]|uniref:HEAT repeat domain-containing protein n=1 Tax=Streptomyces sp. NPDC048370 TaxID=3365540 RepID=UPI003714647B
MNLTYARKMVTAGRALEVLRPDGIDTGDFYRAAWVQAISALEHWVQEEVLRRVAERADKDSPQMPGKLREFRLPLESVESVQRGDVSLAEAVVEHVRADVAYRSLQNPDAIAQIMESTERSSGHGARSSSSQLVAPHFLAPGPPMTTHIEKLIQQLDDSTGPSYDARAELIDIGPDAIPVLIDGLPSLGGFGQLTAIEVFEEVADPRCGPALIALLGSDDSTVREWAAMALASLEIDGAVEPLRRAYRACLERATPPDCWKPPKPPSATTSSSPPLGSTGPTCTPRGDRCRPSTPRKSATATWSRAT